MPCYDERSTGSYVTENEVKPLKAEVTRLRNRLDNLTRVACEMGTVLKHRAHLDDLSSESLGWLKSHEKFDRKRKAKK